MIETRDRILDSAEKLFADGGYAATSLRSIMAEAGVNVAAIHYYFRSKESLLEAVLLRRIEPANAERLAALEGYRSSVNGGEWQIEPVLEAFLYPTFRMAADPHQGGNTFVRLLGRLQAESDLLPQLVVRHFGPVLLEFAGALARALPQLPQEELFWRARLAMGATAQILRDAPRIKSRPARSTSDWRSILDRLVPFLSAGFRAPLETSSNQNRAALTAVTQET